jgi:hypothetical protein
MPTTERKRTTVSIESEDLEALRALAKAYEWPVGKAAHLAIKTLATIMGAHEAYAQQHPEDVAAVYRRLARQAPADFVEVPKEGVRAGHAGDVPAVQLGDWLITDLDGDLMAEEMGGQRRLGKLVDGEVKVLRLPIGDAGLN